MNRGLAPSLCHNKTWSLSETVARCFAQPAAVRTHMPFRCLDTGDRPIRKRRVGTGRKKKKQDKGRRGRNKAVPSSCSEAKVGRQPATSIIHRYGSEPGAAAVSLLSAMGLPGALGGRNWLPGAPPSLSFSLSLSLSLRQRSVQRSGRTLWHGSAISRWDGLPTSHAQSNHGPPKLLAGHSSSFRQDAGGPPSLSQRNITLTEAGADADGLMIRRLRRRHLRGRESRWPIRSHSCGEARLGCLARLGRSAARAPPDSTTLSDSSLEVGDLWIRICPPGRAP
ncbi:hypothetical protein CDD83_9989 [Cordyceps sp. RAO-2017]|nr:hypothetical protein CDD83_9989 [Cordyceps sp. RAO-2017]